MQVTDSTAIETAPIHHICDHDDGPHFAAWAYPNGLITVSVSNTGDPYLNGWTGSASTSSQAWPLPNLLGSRCWPDHAVQGKPRGPLGNLRRMRLAQDNDRPRVFMDQGLEAL